jgi:hypothetical protein
MNQTEKPTTWENAITRAACTATKAHLIRKHLEVLAHHKTLILQQQQKLDGHIDVYFHQPI